MKNIFILLLSLAVVEASPFPFPQAVTEAISPPTPPSPGCSTTILETFGILVLNITDADLSKREAESSTEMNSSTSTAIAVAPVSQIEDGQVQGGMQTMTIAAVSQILDGQVQNPASIYVSGINSTSTQSQAIATGTAIRPLCDVQTQEPKSTLVATQSTQEPSPSTATSSISSTDDQSSTTMAACKNNSTLQLILVNSTLKDGFGRTGYIASNYQFQFDEPPQSGAIYTSGWFVCANGSLALGGSNVFWQCLSGDFYNLYDRNWAAQCSPITINMLQLRNCLVN